MIKYSPRLGPCISQWVSQWVSGRTMTRAVTAPYNPYKQASSRSASSRTAQTGQTMLILMRTFPLCPAASLQRQHSCHRPAESLNLNRHIKVTSTKRRRRPMPRPRFVSAAAGRTFHGAQFALLDSVSNSSMNGGATNNLPDDQSSRILQNGGLLGGMQRESRVPGDGAAGLEAMVTEALFMERRMKGSTDSHGSGNDW